MLFISSRLILVYQTRLKPVLSSYGNLLIYWFLYVKVGLSPIHLIVAFHIETSHLICIANQMANSYME